MVLLDTDVMVDLLRGFPPAVAWVESLRHERFLLPGYVVRELIQGCSNRRETHRVLKFISAYRIAWPSMGDYSRTLADFALARVQRKIGILDVLIGECTVGSGLPIHTLNVRHFTAIPGLRVTLSLCLGRLCR